MPRPELKEFVNFDHPENKRRVQGFVAPLSGDYEVTITPRRAMRSTRQNAYFHGCVVDALRRFLNEQDYDVTSHDAAAQILKDKFLRVPVVNRRTGEVAAERVRSTTELNTSEMTDFIERSRAWLADFFGIVVPDPDPEYRRKPEARPQRRKVPA